jgi:hypothetical protein
LRINVVGAPQRIKVQTPMLMKPLADLLDPHYGGCMHHTQ